MTSHHTHSRVVTLLTVTLIIGFLAWLVRPRGIPDDVQLDVNYSKAVKDSRETFRHHPVWEGGLAAPEILRVAEDGAFTVTQQGKVIHTGYVCCIEDAGDPSDQLAVARFRVDYVIFQGEPSASTVEWLCTYYPRPKLKGPSLETWTPIQTAAAP